MRPAGEPPVRLQQRTAQARSAISDAIDFGKLTNAGYNAGDHGASVRR